MRRDGGRGVRRSRVPGTARPGRIHGTAGPGGQRASRSRGSPSAATEVVAFVVHRRDRRAGTRPAPYGFRRRSTPFRDRGGARDDRFDARDEGRAHRSPIARGTSSFGRVVCSRASADWRRGTKIAYTQRRLKWACLRRGGPCARPRGTRALCPPAPCAGRRCARWPAAPGIIATGRYHRGLARWTGAGASPCAGRRSSAGA